MIKKMIFKKHVVFITLSLMFYNMLFSQKVAVVSDLQGATPSAYQTSILAKGWNPDLIITLGDNYSTYSGTIDDQIGQYFADFIFPYVGAFGAGDTVNRFFPSMGNHDNDGGDLTNYLNFFTLPNNERYYDFVKGDIHFFALHSFPTEPDGIADTSIQGQWLKNQLAASTSCYNIVYFHHPPYSSGLHGSSSYMQWPFVEWGATAVLSGHDHCYERLFANGLTYLISPPGGEALYTNYNPLPGSLVHYSGNYGALLIDANADSIQFQFININDSVVDRFAITHCALNTGQLEPSEVVELKTFPNPFTSEIAFQFNLPHDGFVKIEIFDVFGNKVDALFNGHLQAGKHVKKWSAEKLKSGIYFYQFEFDKKTIAGKIMITGK
ncbi:MAG: metallophosphoesterase [Bacteroidota bacterium]